MQCGGWPGPVPRCTTKVRTMPPYPIHRVPPTPPPHAATVVYPVYGRSGQFTRLLSVTVPVSKHQKWSKSRNGKNHQKWSNPEMVKTTKNMKIIVFLSPKSLSNPRGLRHFRQKTTNFSQFSTKTTNFSQFCTFRPKPALNTVSFDSFVLRKPLFFMVFNALEVPGFP